MKALGVDSPGLPPSGLKSPNLNNTSPDNTVQKMDKNIPVNKWLTTLSLLEYSDIFRDYRSVQDMMYLGEGDLKNMGIKNGAHRARIASSLYMLREKLQGRVFPKTKEHSPSGSNRSTPSHTPPNFASHPDYAPVTMQYQPLHPGVSPTQSYQKDYQLHNQKIISKHLWYHGKIPRVKAESLVKEDGDFLIRDSISQKGDFVLTCHWNQGPLHFMVNRQSVVDPHTGVIKVQYQFEDFLCDTVPQLINRYVKECKPISEASNAILSNPVNRRISADSLNLISSPQCNEGSAIGNSLSSPFICASSHNISAYTTQKKPKRFGSQPLLSMDDDEGSLMDNFDKHCSVPSIGLNNNNIDTGKSHIPESPIRSDSEPMLLKGSKLKRTGLSRSRELLAASESELSKPPPPKPSRVPTIKLADNKRPKMAIRNQQLYDEEKDYSDYDAIKSWPENVERSVDQGPMFSLLTDLYDSPKSCQLRTSDGSNSSHDSGYLTHDGNTYDPVALNIPDFNPPSKFNLADYNSQILTPNNKPLQGSALSLILPMLLGAESKTLALHSTLLDLDLLKVIGNHDFGLGVKSGLELITLPQGAQLRKDTLERFNCMKLFVASTILLCVNFNERAKMVHQWVQTAHNMRSLGNLFGFAYVMDGLQLEQIKRLKNTWIKVKHEHQTSSLLFEAKLKATYKSLREAGSALPLQNICLPYILPLVDLLERDNTHQQMTFPWEHEDARVDMGMDIILSHLDIARIITEHHGLYRVTSGNVLGNFRPIRDMLEILDTRMHLRFLWGAKAANASSLERYSKYSQILSAMSYKCEPQKTLSMESAL